MPTVTISRQFGAGGKTLGHSIAKQLGYQFIDSQLIQMVAQKAKVSVNWVESVEKEAGGKLQKFVSRLVSKSLVDKVLGDERGYIDEEIYVDLLHQVIRQLADEDNVVILGRGSQYILKDHPDTIHVLLTAEKQDRIRFMEEHYEMTPSQAAKAVNLEDRRRVNLYRKFGKEDYDGPHLYHLAINMSQVHIDKACHMVCGLVQRAG